MGHTARNEPESKGRETKTTDYVMVKADESVQAIIINLRKRIRYKRVLMELA